MPHPHHIRRAVAGTLLTGALALAGCGSQEEPEPAAAVPTPSAVQTTTSAAPPPTTAPTTQAPEPEVPKLGDKQTTDLGTATVYSVKFPVQGDSSARDIRDKGMQFAVADIKVCANGTTDADGYGFDASNFQLTDTEARTYEFWNVQIGARSPNLTDSVSGNDTPRDGSCKRGWLTFQLPPKTKIASVEYAPSGGGTPLTWKVGR